MTLGFKCVAVTAACVLLAGCAYTEPETFKGPQPLSLAAVAANPTLQKLDIASFVDATVFYPTGGSEHHSVKVADYLIYKVMALLPEDARKARLNAFYAQCDMSRLIAPRLVCNAKITLQVDGRAYEGALDSVDLGNVYIYQQPIYGSGKRFILEQVSKLIDMLTAKIEAAVSS